MGQHPGVHRAAFFLEAPFPSLSWFLGGLVPGLGSFFFSNNSASSDRSSSLISLEPHRSYKGILGWRDVMK